MNYMWLRAIHVVVDFVWISTMFAISLLNSLDFLSPSPNRLHTLRRLNNFLAVPCMIIVWAAGARLAYAGGWFGDLWLTIKLSIAFLLSLYQIVLTVELNIHKRHLITKQANRFYISFIVLILASAIIELVMVKPH